MTASKPRITDRLALWQIDAIGLGVCALLAAVWYLVGLEPLSQAKAARVSLDAQLAERTGEADRVRALKADLDRLLASTRRQILAGQVQLAAADQLTQRVGQLTHLAGEHNLRLDEIKPGLPASLPRFTTVPIHVTGGGSFTDCVRFLRDVHGKFPDVGLSAMNLKGEPEMPERGARFTFDLVWYAAPGAAPGHK